MLLLRLEVKRLAQVYQELCKKHPTFRERSENTDLAVRFACACLVVACPSIAGHEQSMGRFQSGRRAPFPEGGLASSHQSACRHGHVLPGISHVLHAPAQLPALCKLAC